MEVTTGIIETPVKVCLYGVEGIGKTTFASKFPKPIFLDLDKGTSRLDVARIRNISSWAMLISTIKEIYGNPDEYKTLVIDTADAAERLCIEHICNKYNKDGIEDFGYGNGYTYLTEEYARFLTLLETCITQGINVVILAHAILKTVTIPDEMGSYDHWELKLSKKTTNQVAPLVKEWADVLLFANYKTLLVQDGNNTKKKAAGGKRMMWTSHTPFADAKNRFGLSEELEFDYANIAHIVPNNTSPLVASIETPKAPTKEVKQKEKPMKQEAGTTTVEPTNKPLTNKDILLKKLNDIMAQEKITESEVRKAVGMRGYFPESTPIEMYPEDFIEGCLIGAWEQIKALIVSEISPFTN